MEKIRIIIADTDEDFVRHAAGILGGHVDVEIAATASDGSTALQITRKLHPDVLLFDFLLPGLDGISLLKSIVEMKNPPVAIGCTRFYSTFCLETARKLGAAYVLFKPIEFGVLYATVRNCLAMHQKILKASNNPEGKAETTSLEIRNYLVSLGIPSKLIGCSYLAEAVRLAKSDISLTQNLSKGLYLEISRSMDTNPSCVERSIRNAISTAFQTGRMNDHMVTCPSNKEFINYVLRTLEKS